MKKLSTSLLFTFALATGSVAHADTNFGAGSLIIPASATYQTDCGAASMYGLVYNVLRANAWLASNGYGTIEVYYAYKESKGSPNRCTPTNLHTPPAPSANAAWNDGCDFEIISNDVVPVKLVKNVDGAKTLPVVAENTSFSTINTTTNSMVWPQWAARTIQRTPAAPSTNVNTVRYWGGSFIINDADASTFLRILQVSGANAIIPRDSANNPIDFSPFRDRACSWPTTIGGTVNIHRAQAAFTAPTPKVFTAPPPRLALLARNVNQNPADGSNYNTTITNASTGRVADNILQGYLARAGLTFNGAQGCPAGGQWAGNTTICPIGGNPGQIYDLFDFRDIQAGRLNSTSLYKMLWAPHWELKGTSPNPAEQTAINQIATFLDGQRGLMAECASVEALEGIQAGWLADSAAIEAGQFQTCRGTTSCTNFTGTRYGLTKNSGGSNALTSNPTGNLFNCSDPDRAASSSCVYYGYPGDPFAQVAEYKWDSDAYTAGSHLADFKPATSWMYRPGVKPLISGVRTLDKTKLGSPTAARAMITGDFATRSYKDNDQNKSNILYLGNHDLTTSVSGVKVVLQTLLQLGDPVITPVTTEVSRSSPITAVFNGEQAIVQGTFESVSPSPTATTVTSDDVPLLAAFQFPHIKGHMRAMGTSSITTAGGTFDVQTELFDAADRFPAVNLSGCTPAFQGACRTVFTNIATGQNPATVVFSNSAATVTTLGPLLGPSLNAATRKTLIERVIAGVSVGSVWLPKLGGVDRSTVAMIPPSLVAGQSSRPTVIYFGATDGMLHAVCGVATGTAPCDVLGRELWAFMPRTQLPKVRLNQTRIDGSPRVVDMFGDFDNDGTNGFHTILFFQTGWGAASIAGETPAVYALDITNPTSPRVLWEYTTPASRTTTELGQGLRVTAGQILNGGVLKNAAIVQTNNGGTGGSGNVVMAIDAITGAQLWKTSFVFPTAAPFPPGRSAAAGPIPATGIPGGTVGLDKTGAGSLTDVVFGTLYGDMWLLNAGDGTNRHGSNPLFRFTADRKPFGVPPAIYSDGSSYFAVAASGGYVDQSAVALWSAGTQQIVSVNLDTPPSATASGPLTELSGPPNVPWVINLGANEKGFAQAHVVGDEIILTVDSTDVNATGFGTGGTNTGKVLKFDADQGNSMSTLVVASGASTVAIGDGTYFHASGKQVVKGNETATPGGNALHAGGMPSIDRMLWLRTL